MIFQLGPSQGCDMLVMNAVNFLSVIFQIYLKLWYTILNNKYKEPAVRSQLVAMSWQNILFI